MNKLDDLKLQVLSLPAAERAELLDEIQASFGEKERDAIDSAWLEGKSTVGGTRIVKDVLIS